MKEIIEVKYINEQKGRGVFAKKRIPEGTIIDKAYILLISNEDFTKIENTKLYDYTFTWEDPKFPGHDNALAFGICQLINHSYAPNVEYLYDYDNQMIEYVTIREIQKGEELTVNYNGKEKDKSPLWFEIYDEEIKKI